MPKVKTKSGAKKRFKLTGFWQNKKKACFQEPYPDKEGN